MGNVITSASFATPTSYIKLNENGAFPASNIGAYTKPYRTWKGTDCVSGSTYVGAYYSTPAALVGVLLDNINVASIKIQAHTSDSWGAPDYDSGALTVSKDPWDSRYKVILIGDGTTPYATKSYWRVVTNTSTPVSGSVMSLGGWLGLTAVTTWDTNPGFPYEVTPCQGILTNDDFASEADEPVELGNRYAVLTLNQSVMPLAMKSTLGTVLSTYSPATPFVFFRNNSDTSEVYIVHRVGRAKIALAGPNHYQLEGLTMREYA